MLTRFCSTRSLTSLTRRPRRVGNSRNCSTESSTREPEKQESPIVEDSVVENIEYQTVASKERTYANGLPALTIKRFSRLSTANDVIRFFQRHAGITPSTAIRTFDAEKKRVVSWRVEFQSTKDAEKASAAVLHKQLGLFAQPRLLPAAPSYRKDIMFRPEDLFVEISDAPAGMKRKDLVHFLRVGSVTPTVILEMPGNPGTGTRWFAKYATPEERTIALIKRSGQYMHPYGRTDVISEKKLKVTPLFV